MKNRLKLISGTANPKLARKIAKYLDIPLCKVDISRFSDGEISIRIAENVREKDVFIVQPTFSPAENLMELLLLIDACSRASARRITAVIPYYGYARQDRKDRPRVPISAKLIANLITVAGASRVLALELHAAQIQGFFDIQVDNLFAAPVLLKYIKKRKLKNVTVVSPDVGGIKIGRAFAKRLNSNLAIVDKRRTAADASEVMNVIGDVKGSDIIILDDIISTAGTITQAAEALRKEGAKRIIAAATHPVFSGNALERLKDSCIEEVIVTNSIPFEDPGRCKKVKVLDVSPLLGEAIRRIHTGESISKLFI
ncbi:MAG: phosphoribosylpyrophosphate synthetase [Candidatus Latescibacteria bacterium 4484_7]|nr:MAG: phosphoribosylpyrophosphate synthetase [Candidatus Latescibacteria bacterium 4484_7]